MRRSTTLLLAVLTGACAPRAEPLTAAHAAAIRDSVAAALTEFRRFSAVGQWDSLATFYSDEPGLRFVEDGAVKLRAVAELRRALGALPAGVTIETTYHDTDIAAAAPGVASVTTGYETRFVDSDATKVSFGGMLTLVLVHRGGMWRILTGHSSSPPRRSP